MLGFFPVNLCDLRLGFPRLPCNSPPIVHPMFARR
jgi:hypothetical protein